MATLNRHASPVDVMSANQFVMSSLPSAPPQPVPSSPATGKGNSKKASKKNGQDSDKPKRPLSAYNLFFQHERAQILKSTPSKYEGNKPRRSHGKIGFASLARSVASKWNNIDPETRKHFDELAAADKARYKKEMEAWKAAQTLKQNATTNATKDLLCPPPSMCMPPTINAQSIVKCNLMAASQASQHSGQMVFSKFRPVANGMGAVPIAPVATPSATFFFQNLNNMGSSNANMGVGKASAVVGQALALLEDDTMPSFQPLDDTTLESVETDESSLSSSSASRRGSGSSPPISELAAKLDDDCLGFMSGLLF